MSEGTLQISKFHSGAEMKAHTVWLFDNCALLCTVLSWLVIVNFFNMRPTRSIVRCLHSNLVMQAVTGLICESVLHRTALSLMEDMPGFEALRGAAQETPAS